MAHSAQISLKVRERHIIGEKTDSCYGPKTPGKVKAKTLDDLTAEKRAQLEAEADRKLQEHHDSPHDSAYGSTHIFCFL